MLATSACCLGIGRIDIMAKVHGLKLLSVGTNAKTIKGDGTEYLTAILYLRPNLQLCAKSKIAGCAAACLYTAGRGVMNSVKAARTRKAVLLENNPELFMAMLKVDLQRFENYCDRKEIQPCVRLNGTSDYDFRSIMGAFPSINFYDYSKCYERALENNPPNYHITLSYSEASASFAEIIRRVTKKTGVNMAVVFRDKENIPETYSGRMVINGDQDDLRFLDPKGVVVALYAKGKAKKDTTGFVIN